MDKEFYLPRPEHLAVQSTLNRQGRDQVLSADESAKVLEVLRTDAEQCYAHYEEMLNVDLQGNVIDQTKPNLARELARMNLTLNHYTQWYWKIDLHNLFHFLRLRADDHAQYEIRVYALEMLKIMKDWVPLCYEAFMAYKMNAVTISAKAKEVIQRMMKGEKVNQETSGLNPREWREFMEAFEFPLASTENAA